MNHSPADNISCRYTSHKKKCKDLYMNCPAWVQVRGVDQNTGLDVDGWNCTDTWLPILLIDNSQQQRQTGAAVESFRNEMVRANETGQRLLAASVQARIAAGDTE